MHSLEVEVFGEALDAGVADVDSVQEAEHVEHRDDRHAVPVYFASDSRLFGIGPGEFGEGGVGGGGIFGCLFVVEGCDGC